MRSLHRDSSLTWVAFLLWSALACTDAFSIVAVSIRQAQLSTLAQGSFVLHSNLASAPEIDHSEPLNGEHMLQHLETLNLTIAQEEILPEAPPLSYDKFLTMQDKRVVLAIRYSGESGLRPYFLTVAKKLKQSHPDVIVERRILPKAEVEATGEAIFEILVDGKVVVGKNRSRRQRVSRVDMSRARSVFVSMQELDVAISRARRRRRPTTVYGEIEHAKKKSLSVILKKPKK